MSQLIDAPDATQARTTPFPQDSELYYPVSLKPIAIEDDPGKAFDDPCYDASGFTAVVRDDTGTVLGVHRKGYKAVPNKELYQGFEDVLMEADISLAGFTVEDHIAYHGRRVSRDYIFPGVTVEPRVGDTVELKVSVVNSFDAYKAFQVFVAGYRLWCTNGAVSRIDGVNVYGRHTKGFGVQFAVGKINQALEKYMALSNDWRKWAGREISDAQATQTFEAFPDVNNTLLKRFEEYWTTESGESGKTVWALYNTLTHWSTHAPVRQSSEPNRSAIVLDREGRVRRFLGSPAFTNLAA